MLIRIAIYYSQRKEFIINNEENVQKEYTPKNKFEICVSKKKKKNQKKKLYQNWVYSVISELEKILVKVH